MTLVSDGIRFVRIFAEVLWGGASDDSGVVENVNFQLFSLAIFSETGDEASVIIQRYAVHRQLFSDLKMHDLE